MFWHLYGGRLRSLLRDKENLFWTLLFPILLATMFYVAFSNLMSTTEDFNPVPVAVVDDEAYRLDDGFRQVLDELSVAADAQEVPDGKLFRLTVTGREDADRLLEAGEVEGVITVGGDGTDTSDGIGLKLKSSGINQSIIKSFLDEYAQTSAAMQSILSENPAAVQQLVEQMSQRQESTQAISYSDSKPDTMLNYFYALIAMACLYGCFWGLRNTNDIQADLSTLGARRSVAPSRKMTAVLADAGAALTVHFGEILIVLAYLILALKVDFGSRFGYVLLTCFMGCVTGVSYGTFVGAAIRKKDSVKNAIMIGLTMLLCFLSGLMVNGIRQFIADTVPVLNYINPAALITDAFYSLYVYASTDRFFLNIGILGGIALLFITGSVLLTRRQKYASL
ncbi:MAG: ABC transporter permease [Clostridiales bacterium]|jgi:ABC-2 type transport system permease protein|nr:ABC transporter permease [Clostridiales bacterium]